MTHLKIEQNNGIIEEVSSAVIDKLYDIVHSGNLDNTSNLIGRLHTTATYQDYIDYLEDTFKVDNVKLLIIDATKKYIRFADPEVLSYWANSAYGDGTSITSTSAATVLNIPNNAFKSNTSILTFDELGRYFPNCTAINYYAFLRCSNLTSIDLSNITTVGLRAFDSSGLSGVLNLPKVTSLEEGCFALTNDITEINIGANISDSNKITVLNLNVFNHSGQNGNLLQKVTGLNKVLEIKSDAFYNCRQLLSIDTTSELTTIRGEAFSGCSSLECIDISNVTLIENFGLGYCSSLVDLATSNPTQKNTGAATYTFDWSTVPISVFAGDPLNNKSFVFPNATLIKQSAFNSTKIVAISAPNVTSLESLVFREADQLVSVSLPNANTIGDMCFYNCSNLTTIDLSNVTTIGSNAFYGCSALTTVTGINNITNLGENAFRNCTSLGTGLTLELNLTNQTRHFGSALRNTKFTRMIFHVSNNSIIGDANNPPLAGYPSTTYLDASDFPLFLNNGNLTRVLSSTGDAASLVTCIFPSNLNWLVPSNFKTNIGGYRYMIILATTPPDLEDGDHNNPLSSWFVTNSILHIYVPDSAKSAYLADSKWSQIAGLNGAVTITDRLHGLSELPNGVWTTGLASLYLTPALLATS